jgi:hypothetical protein
LRGRCGAQTRGAERGRGRGVVRGEGAGLACKQHQRCSRRPSCQGAYLLGQDDQGNRPGPRRCPTRRCSLGGGQGSEARWRRKATVLVRVRKAQARARHAGLCPRRGRCSGGERRALPRTGPGVLTVGGVLWRQGSERTGGPLLGPRGASATGEFERAWWTLVGQRLAALPPRMTAWTPGLVRDRTW